MIFQLAEEHGVKFMETSAKSGLNVETAFLMLAKDIKNKMDRKNVRERERGRGEEGREGNLPS